MGWTEKLGSWLVTTLLPDVATGVVTSVAVEKHIDHERGEGEKRRSIGHLIGESLGEAVKAYQFDRAVFLNELYCINENTGGDLEALIKLFDDMELTGCVYTLKLPGNRRRRYTEDEIGGMLLLVPEDNRLTIWQWLSELLEEKPSKFFAKLELLADNKWEQRANLAKTIVRQNKPVIKKAARSADAEAAKAIRELRLWLAKKGVR